MLIVFVCGAPTAHLIFYSNNRNDLGPCQMKACQARGVAFHQSGLKVHRHCLVHDKALTTPSASTRRPGRWCCLSLELKIRKATDDVLCRLQVHSQQPGSVWGLQRAQRPVFPNKPQRPGLQHTLSISCLSGAGRATRQRKAACSCECAPSCGQVSAIRHQPAAASICLHTNCCLGCFFRQSSSASSLRLQDICHSFRTTTGLDASSKATSVYTPVCCC